MSLTVLLKNGKTFTAQEMGEAEFKQAVEIANSRNTGFLISGSTWVRLDEIAAFWFEAPPKKETKKVKKDKAHKGA